MEKKGKYTRETQKYYKQMQKTSPTRPINNLIITTFIYSFILLFIFIFSLILQKILNNRTKREDHRVVASKTEPVLQQQSLFGTGSISFFIEEDTLSLDLEASSGMGVETDELTPQNSQIGKASMLTANNKKLQKKLIYSVKQLMYLYSDGWQQLVGWLSLILRTCKAWIALRFASIVDEPYQTILWQLVFGAGGYVSPSLEYSIKTMGIQHIFSVSGANFAILAAGLELLCHRMSRIVRLLFLSLLLGFYSLMIGAEYPVIRACCMYLYAAFGKVIFQVQVAPLFGLLIWVGTVLAAFPEALSSLSFQLTVTATIGICLFYKVLSGRVGIFFKKTSLISLFTEQILIGLSVFLLISPVLVIHFGELSLASVVYTALLFWLFEAASFLGYLLFAYSIVSTLFIYVPVLQHLDVVLAYLPTMVLTPLLKILEYSVYLPGLTLNISERRFIFAFCWLGIVFTWYLFSRRQVKKRVELRVAMVT